MTSLFVLIPISLLLLGVAIWAFVWSVNHGQFDDLESPSVRILFDDDLVGSREHISEAEETGPAVHE